MQIYLFVFVKNETKKWNSISLLFTFPASLNNICPKKWFFALMDKGNIIFFLFSCEDKMSCGECMAGPSCAWCQVRRKTNGFCLYSMQCDWYLSIQSNFIYNKHTAVGITTLKCSAAILKALKNI
jgi:hypothetical protein